MQAMQAVHAPERAAAIDRTLREKALIPFVHTLFRLGYWKFEVAGTEHLPRDGRVVYAPNHAGWFALDAFFLSLAVEGALGPERTPFFAASDAALATPVVGSFLRRAGALPASWFRRPERLPPEVQSVGIFPEGVYGNTKPFWRAYRMKQWNRGFVRVAAALGLPIVPVAVMGGEECLPVAWTVKRFEKRIGSIFGLPLTPLPLPTRWKVVFHEPVRVPGGKAILADPDAAAEFAARTRAIVQATLDRHAGTLPLAKLSSFVATAELIPSKVQAVRARAVLAP
jgi:1-acyl-sn-glycerol-3-phosphate acyltransferase